ncbi:MAG TPA: hypothetical protein VFR94_07930 [Nitrososphaeraceae archaeon]|nr:hypothetical protein [Nitrososphaeraceae archaeon]
MQSISRDKREEKRVVTKEQQSPIYSFMYALKSSETRRQYPKRLKMLYDYLGLAGSLEEQATGFLEKARKNPQWCQDSIVVFFDFISKELDVKNLLQALSRTTTELPNYFAK